MSTEGAAAVLAAANERDGTAWSLVGRLAGGYQQGAYELADAAGARAILKWHTGHLPWKQVLDTARVLAAARLRGWPTSEWLAYGPLAGDGAYIVEEFIEGERPTRLESLVLDRLLDAIRLQADARPETHQDWSAYISGVVFEGEAELAARMRAGPETAALLRRLERLTAGARSPRLPASDLVHGDFVLSNVLVRDARPVLVDAAHAGKGTRAYDLATLLMETAVGGDYTVPSPADQARIANETVAIVGRGGLFVCVACRMMHLLVFGEDSWRTQIPGTVTRCHAFLDDLERAIG